LPSIQARPLPVLDPGEARVALPKKELDPHAEGLGQLE